MAPGVVQPTPRHSALGYLTALEYEDQHTDGHQLTNP
jgi:hypothetical protein